MTPITNTAQYLLKRDPVGEFLIAIEDHADIVDWSPATEDDLKALGVTEDELFEVRRGYTIVCQTIAFDTLDALIAGYND